MRPIGLSTIWHHRQLPTTTGRDQHTHRSDACMQVVITRSVGYDICLTCFCDCFCIYDESVLWSLLGEVVAPSSGSQMRQYDTSFERDRSPYTLMRGSQHWLIRCSIVENTVVCVAGGQPAVGCSSGVRVPTPYNTVLRYCPISCTRVPSYKRSTVRSPDVNRVPCGPPSLYSPPNRRPQGVWYWIIFQYRIRGVLGFM